MFQSAAARPVPDSSPVPEGPAPTNLFSCKKRIRFYGAFPSGQETKTSFEKVIQSKNIFSLELWKLSQNGCYQFRKY
jgi:hypothetical protein